MLTFSPTHTRTLRARTYARTYAHTRRFLSSNKT